LGWKKERFLRKSLLASRLHLMFKEGQMVSTSIDALEADFNATIID